MTLQKDFREKELPGIDGNKRKCFYGPIKIVDEKFKEVEDDSNATILLDGELVIENNKILSFLICG